MKERIKELYIQSLQETRLARRPDLGPIDEEVINKILEMESRGNTIERFTKLLLKDFLSVLEYEREVNNNPHGYQDEEYYIRCSAKVSVLDDVIDTVKSRYEVE